MENSKQIWKKFKKNFEIVLHYLKHMTAIFENIFEKFLLNFTGITGLFGKFGTIEKFGKKMWSNMKKKF